MGDMAMEDMVITSERDRLKLKLSQKATMVATLEDMAMEDMATTSEREKLKLSQKATMVATLEDMAMEDMVTTSEREKLKLMLILSSLVSTHMEMDMPSQLIMSVII